LNLPGLEPRPLSRPARSQSLCGEEGKYFKSKIRRKEVMKRNDRDDVRSKVT
jgi:hypothetical protein